MYIQVQKLEIGLTDTMLWFVESKKPIKQVSEDSAPESVYNHENIFEDHQVTLWDSAMWV